MSRFTPGPWIIQDDSVSKNCEMPDKIVGPVQGLQVCHVYTDNKNEIANAHLISAAPEMFEAIDSLLKFLDMNWQDRNIKPRELDILKLQSAIAKARGEK